MLSHLSTKYRLSFKLCPPKCESASAEGAGFWDKLKLQAYRAIRHRIDTHCFLMPYDFAQTKAYIEKQLATSYHIKFKILSLMKFPEICYNFFADRFALRHSAGGGTIMNRFLKAQFDYLCARFWCSSQFWRSRIKIVHENV